MVLTPQTARDGENKTPLLFLSLPSSLLLVSLGAELLGGCFSRFCGSSEPVDKKARTIARRVSRLKILNIFCPKLFLFLTFLLEKIKIQTFIRRNIYLETSWNERFIYISHVIFMISFVNGEVSEFDRPF